MGKEPGTSFQFIVREFTGTTGNQRLSLMLGQGRCTAARGTETGKHNRKGQCESTRMLGDPSSRLRSGSNDWDPRMLRCRRHAARPLLTSRNNGRGKLRLILGQDGQ